ncbi:hypothetical protein J3D49_005147 [Pseudomonas kilonensis]|nr:hypothetical protein [Pseudomonas kilonensis]
MQTHRIPVVSHQQTRPLEPTRRSLSGTFPLRNGDGISYESLLERDFLARVTFSNQICGVISQLVQIPFQDDRALLAAECLRRAYLLIRIRLPVALFLARDHLDLF